MKYNLFTLSRLVINLGLVNVFRVQYYKLSIKFRFNSSIYLKSNLDENDVYYNPRQTNNKLPKVKSWENKNIFNSYFNLKISKSPPNWFFQQFSKKTSNKQQLRWYEIADFDPDLGDIKPIWDLSRMDWVVPLSQQSKKGDKEALKILNIWLNDWKLKNPPYLGVNWKCGQEASIRVIHLVMGAFLLNQLKNPSNALIQLIITHLKRIEPTTSYAIGQSNNHGTSEGAALFIGGSFLYKNGISVGKKWQKKGKKILEMLVRRLILSDGTFSQYSLNYHRLMLDSLNCCEFFRREFNLISFSETFYKKSELASEWLFNMIDISCGDGPNIGANDGARIIPLTNCLYRDYRPTVQLATLLFKNRLAFQSGIWDDQFKWLKLNIKNKKFIYQKSVLANKGGFAMFRQNEVFACLKYPRYTFRPSQNDILHLDLWINGKNIFRDGGSYSYNENPEKLAYFSSIQSHNSIEFDNREPMSRISRFLYYNWIKTSWISKFLEKKNLLNFGVSYVDNFNSFHRRNIELKKNELNIIDDIGNFDKNAILRWRLISGDWKVTGNKNFVLLNSKIHKINIKIKCSETIKNFNLEKGYESLQYLKISTIPVLKVILEKECRIISTINW